MKARRALAVFVVLLGLAAWPWPGLRARVSVALCSTLDPLLEPLVFGHGGHASLRPVPALDVRRPGEQVTSDALLRLTIAGMRGDSLSTLNLRRELYLPLVILTAATLAAPLSWRQRLRALALGLPLAFAACFASLYLTICYLFAHQAPAIYPLGALRLQLLDTLVGTLLMPPSVRFFVPLALAALTLALSHGLRHVRASR